MISLALSSAKLRSPETPAPAGAAQGESGTFSIVLASLKGKQADGDGEVAAAIPSATDAQDSLPVETGAGTALPVPVETGKTLPDIAAAALESSPAKSGEALEDGGPADGARETAGTGGTAAVAAPLPMPAVGAAPETATAPESKGAAPPAASSAHADEALPSPAALPAPVKRQGGQQADAPAVALHVAPEADTEGPRRARPQTTAEFLPVKAREAAVEGPMPRAPSADAAPQAPSTSFAQGLQAESPHAGRPAEAARPMLQAGALQDLTRVVDRLAAAREALAPATAALAVKHVEFGELSLRFDQQRDGQLAVQLSASDPDAHRAVAAAVGERGSAALADSQTGAGQSQAQARGAAAGREGSGDDTGRGDAARQDQPRHGRSAPQDGQPATGDRHAGIFA